MSRDIEELLRDGLDRLTTGASAPADLVQRARQARRRRRAARGGLATGAAAAVAGTVAMAVAVAGGGSLASTAGGPARPPGAAHPAVHHVQTVADIVHQANRALDTSNLIMVSMTNARVLSLEHVNGHRKIAVLHSIGYSYRNRMTAVMFTGPNTFAGPHHVNMVISSEMSSTKPGTMSNTRWTELDYWNRTWATSTRREPAGPTPAPTSLACSSRQKLSKPDAVLRTYLSTSPASIKSALACGGLVKAGTETVQGVRAIRLTSTSKLTSHQLTIDVSPDTFLPVRVVFGDIEMDYRWLQPTAANLAKLTPHIPRGFRQTHENVAQ
ncbi:MAG TPA: hypothetical protein VF204_18080 [Streptosporangiaceae bacterium]